MEHEIGPYERRQPWPKTVLKRLLRDYRTFYRWQVPQSARTIRRCFAYVPERALWCPYERDIIPCLLPGPEN